MAIELDTQESGATSDGAPISAINITPFVDVVLVLLVIFMVTAPTLLKDTLGIRLPKASSSEGGKPESLAVAINEQGQILVNGILSSPEQLSLEAQAALTRNPAVQALIAADENSRHWALVTVIDTLKQVGLERFAIQVQKQTMQKKNSGEPGAKN
ncbi:MAG: ExbD/TolR family protein [Oligoflexia bacterium]|jgi:biopolymer transport protein ExbD